MLKLLNAAYYVIIIIILFRVIINKITRTGRKIIITFRIFNDRVTYAAGLGRTDRCRSGHGIRLATTLQCINATASVRRLHRIVQFQTTCRVGQCGILSCMTIS